MATMGSPVVFAGAYATLGIGPPPRVPANVPVYADLALADRRTLGGRALLVEYRPPGKDIPRA